MLKQNTNSIRDLIYQFLKETGLETGLLHTRIYALWDELLGTTVAKNTRKKYIKGNTLYVQLDSSVIRNQLFMIKQDIIKQLNEQVGKQVIKELVLT